MLLLFNVLLYNIYLVFILRMALSDTSFFGVFFSLWGFLLLVFPTDQGLEERGGCE